MPCEPRRSLHCSRKDHAYGRCRVSPDDRFTLQERTMLMADAVIDLLKAHFRQLRLPTMSQEFERLARDAAATNQNYFQFLLRLAETELATRAANTVTTRIKNAEFPVLKDFDTFDFTILPQLSKPKVLELARCEWIEHKYNCCLVGSHGTGKTHIAVALAQAACRQGLRVRFFTAAALVTELEKAQKQYTLDRFLGQLERVHLLICDELGYVSLSRGGVELLFRIFADRYERGSLLITTNLPFGEWNQIFQGERMTAALLDRLTHRCHIFEMNGESYRFRESMKSKKNRKSE
jgi:DNA replication protein DnaC